MIFLGKKEENKDNKEQERFFLLFYYRNLINSIENLSCFVNKNEIPNAESENKIKFLREMNITDHQKKVFSKYKKKFGGENLKFKG